MPRPCKAVVSSRSTRRAREDRASLIERLHAELQKALNTPDVVEKLKNQGLEPLPLSPAEFDKMIARDMESHIAIVKKAGLTFN